jgi:hypothetical protein
MASAKRSAKVSKNTKPDIRLVILQRGWVFVGHFEQHGARCRLTGASCVRRWGTTKGLGELAQAGKLPNTVLDATPPVEFHELGIVATVQCDPAKWGPLCAR